MSNPDGQTREFAFTPGMTVAQAWEMYVRLIYAGQSLPGDQELEVRQAFVAAVAWTLGAIVSTADSNADAGIAYLEQLQGEVAAFSQETADRAQARLDMRRPQ